jgi:hypothetical protein
MTQEVLYGAAFERASVVADLTQGEVLGLADACVVLGDAAAPMSDEAAQAAAEDDATEGLVVAGHATDDVVLLTQTCDLQETSPDEYVCLVAPVRRVSERLAREALRGRRPRLAGLPWLDETSVVDLSFITTVERSLLVDVPSRGHPRTPRERQHFANAVSRYLTRPALPDHVNAVLKPFLERIAQRYDKNSAEGHCLNQVAEFRLEATPDVDAEAPALTVLALIDEVDLPSVPAGAEVDHTRVDQLVERGIAAAAEHALRAGTPLEKREGWTALGELWIRPSVERARGATDIGSVELTVLNGAELSYARSLNAPPLDLRYLSTRPA